MKNLKKGDHVVMYTIERKFHENNGKVWQCNEDSYVEGGVELVTLNGHGSFLNCEHLLKLKLAPLIQEAYNQGAEAAANDILSKV